MLIKMIKGWVKNWGAPENWDQNKGPCGGLPARLEQSNESSFWVSAWEPTPEELAVLNKGGSIHLGISVLIHPVVFLRVSEENIN